MRAPGDAGRPRETIPRVVLIYGVLGLAPFLAPPLIGYLAPERSALTATALALYGGLILSFLGGARWGVEIAQDRRRRRPS